MGSNNVLEGEVLPAGEYDPDVERAFSEFRDSLEESDGGGTLMVYRIPLDDNGSPAGNSKAHSRLFATPMGALSLDDVCNKVRREYMRPGEVKICIRLLASRAGERGIRLNRILILERANEQAPPPSGPAGDLASIMATVQRSIDASTARSEALMQRMIEMQMTRAQPAPAMDPMAMMQGVVSMMAVAQKMFAGPAGMIPQAPADPFDQMTKFAALIPRLSALAGGRQDDGGGMGDIIKAAAPAVAEIFKSINANPAKPAPARLPHPQRRQIREPAPRTPAEEVAAEVAQTTAEATSISTEPKGDTMDIGAIKQLVGGLIEIAQVDPNGDKCEEAAGELLRQIPDEADDQIFELVSNAAQYRMKLQFVDPRAALYAEWFEKLRVAVLAGFDTGNGNAPVG